MAEKKYIVSKDGTGDFKSISEAIDAIPKGGEIFVKGGIYDEIINIDKSLTITGDKENIPVVMIKSGTVCTVTENVGKGIDVSYIHFANDIGIYPDIEDEHLAMVEVYGNSVFTQCEFSNSFSTNVKVIGPDIKAEFYNCFVHDGIRNGFFLDKGCNGVIKNCTICGVSNHGISLADSSAIMDNCEIYNCNGKLFEYSAGIALYKKSNGKFINCKIHDIKGDGILVRYSATPVIENCEIYDTSTDGIRMVEESVVTCNNCKIHDTERDGIEVATTSKYLIENCKIYNLKTYNTSGIIIKSNAESGYCRNCNIFNINGFGIFVNENSKANIDNCKISCPSLKKVKYPMEDGIRISTDSEADIKNCNISDFTQNGIYDGSNLSNVEKCEIHDGLNYGINIENAGSNSYSNCKIYNIKGEGIYVDNEANPNLENIEIYKCRNRYFLGSTSGITICSGCSGTYSHLNIHDISGKSIKVKDDANPVFK